MQIALKMNFEKKNIIINKIIIHMQWGKKSVLKCYTTFIYKLIFLEKKPQKFTRIIFFLTINAIHFINIKSHTNINFYFYSNRSKMIWHLL